ncbi:MAG TPA: AmmeMemoRadiSam system protein B [Thermoplasmata archaeon]|nr:AmmeMemoRadiSam system protein B [Thermoplasmata archaeon]
MPRTVRPPAVAGMFYAGNAEALARQLEACFTDSRGPGELPVRHRTPDRHLRAVIVPHAGYPYSGPIAALAYSRIAAERPPAEVLLLGVDHQGASSGAALSDEDWRTPLGPVPAADGLISALHRPPITLDNAAHAGEHSIEVELPFLQYVLPSPKMAALMVRYGPYTYLEEVALAVRRAITGRDVLLVASTDFSHYIPPREAEKLDRLALDEIIARRPQGLYATVAEQDISMCGIAPTTVLLAALAPESLSVRLLRWGHSGEAEAMRTVVGYAALTVEAPAPLSTGDSAG